MVRNRFETALETLLEPRRQRLPRRVQQTESTRELRDRQPARQLQQREWVAPRLCDDAIADAVVEPKRHGRTEKRARVSVAEPVDLELAEPIEIGCRDARGEQQRNRLRQKSARHERENPCRDLVQPLRVVDDGEQRTLVGRLGEQGQDRKSGEETIGRRTFAEAERNLEGVALR